MVSIIVALDSKNGIGKNNDLLFKIPEDFARMQKLTIGHPIIMGRRTFESIGRVLPGRTNVIITRDIDKFKNNYPYVEEIVLSLEDALERAKSAPGADEIFVFGGGQIFKEALEKNLVERLYLTVVQGDFGADTFFPDYSAFKKVISKEEHRSGEYKFKYLTLEK